MLRLALGVLLVLLGGPAWGQNVVIYCQTAAGASLPASVATPCDVVNQARKALALDGLKSDTTDLPGGPTRGLWNGTGTSCTIGVMLADDTVAVTLSNTPAGSLPLRVKRLMTTGTSCTGVVGFW